MTTIVMNMANCAVTEYDEGAVLGAAAGFVARADGLHQLAGGLDGAAAIAAAFQTGRLPGDAEGRKLHAEEAFLSIDGDGPYTVSVSTVEGEAFTYPVGAQRGNERRATLGKGLYSSHWQFGFQSAGADFRLSAMNVKFIGAVSRRI